MFTVVDVFIQAGDRSKASFSSAQDHADGIFLRLSGKHIAALCAADTPDIAGFVKK